MGSNKFEIALSCFVTYFKVIDHFHSKLDFVNLKEKKRQSNGKVAFQNYFIKTIISPFNNAIFLFNYALKVLSGKIPVVIKVRAETGLRLSILCINVIQIKLACFS